MVRYLINNIEYDVVGANEEENRRLMWATRYEFEWFIDKRYSCCTFVDLKVNLPSPKICRRLPLVKITGMESSPSLPRAKRQKLDKCGRLAALEKLRNLKGQKNKADVEVAVDNVYDIVDEKEFAKRAKENQCDWIEDDGTGYLEDGRDFFEDSEDFPGGAISKLGDQLSKKRQRISESTKGKRSIRNLFSNSATTKRKEDPKLEDDSILADILCEINPSECTKSITEEKTDNRPKRQSEDSDEKVVKEYLSHFMKTLKKDNKTSDPEPAKQMNSLPVQNVELACITEANETQSNKYIPNVNESLTDNTILVEDVLHIGIENKEIPIANSCSRESQKRCGKEIPISSNFEEGREDLNMASLFSETNLLSNWCANFDAECGEVSHNNCKLVVTSDEDPETLDIWYWDAWEDPLKRPGEVFLFGKRKNNLSEFESTCVLVENIEKCLYLLPREYILDPVTQNPTNRKVTLIDVYEEFHNVIAKEMDLKKFRSKRVTKKFAFSVPGVHVPETCEYLEVRYSGKYGPPKLKNCYHTIGHIFGASTSALETFLLERKIKGPCWLHVKNFQRNEIPLSWCKTEVKCLSDSSIIVADKQNTPPPMVVMALNIKTYLNFKTLKNEVVIISCLVNNKFYVDKPPKSPPFERHYCGFTRPTGLNWPIDVNNKLTEYKLTKAKKFESERALLSWFLALFQSVDPDLVVTHDANGCQLDVLCDRTIALKIPMSSRLGKLKVSQMNGKRYKDHFIGRLICDVKQSAEELIKSRSYDLETLCTNVLKIREGERIDFTNSELSSMFETSDNLLKLISLNMQDALYILRLMCELNVLPLALQITNICGNIMSRTLQGGRSERNEFLLLHAFYERNYIVPDKFHKEANLDQQDVLNGGKKKPAYSGGLVLEPVKGFYDKYVLLMDFNSLYPSIIQEYNICFTTIKPADENCMPLVPDCSVELGVLPRQIRRLVESRREVKKLMLNADVDCDLKMQYNIRQLALKLTANSMYGCLGFSNSRFFAQHLAALVTYKGREILMNTKSLVQKLNYEVIYGDTDSIMINTNSTDYDQVFKIGNSIKQTVNKIYKQIELDIDGVFKYLLLLKKKKYAALTISKTHRGDVVYTQELKGLDVVRRDWSQISITAGRVIIDEILSDYQMDEKIENIHAHLEKFRDNLMGGNVPLQLLVITKQITKPLKDYSNLNTLPHVQVALRMNASRSKKYKKGDMIGYIICEDGTENPAMQRAYHIEELKSTEKLIVDKNYYLAHQIHPVVSRLCEPLESTDASKIAQCLGLDASKFKIAAQRAHREKIESGVGESFVKSVVEKFRQCEKFKFNCVTCKEENTVASAFKPSNTGIVSVLEKCQNAECAARPYQYVTQIRNQLLLAIRKCVGRFYQNWLVCDEPSCNNNTRTYTHVTKNNKPVCMMCRRGLLIRQYSARDLYQQLSYYQYVFDLSKHGSKGNITNELEQAYNVLKRTVEAELARSAYSTVSLSKLFPQ